MIGLRVMQHEDGREFLRAARAARVAQVSEDDYKQVVKDESELLGLA